MAWMGDRATAYTVIIQKKLTPLILLLSAQQQKINISSYKQNHRHIF
jgi:hypothetical protein